MGCFHNQRMSINERKNIVLYSKYKVAVCEIKNNAKEIFLSLSIFNRSFLGFTNLPYYIFFLEEDIFFSLKQRIKAIHHFVTSIFFFL